MTTYARVFVLYDNNIFETKQTPMTAVGTSRNRSVGAEETRLHTTAVEKKMF